MTFKALLASAAALSLVACSSYGSTESASASAPMARSTITEIVVGSPDHTTLETLVVTAGLADTLSSAGSFTVFAPSDMAFSKVPAATREALAQPANRELLTSILTYHVVAGDFKAADVIGLINANNGSATITTVQGAALTASLDNGRVLLTDATGGKAYVETADIAASNGVIHSISAVVMPGN